MEGGFSWKLSHKYFKSKNIDEINAIIVDVLTQVFGYINASFGYIEDNSFIFAESIGYEIPENTKISLDSASIIVRSIKTKETQLVDDVTKDPDFYSVLTHLVTLS